MPLSQLSDSLPLTTLIASHHFTLWLQAAEQFRFSYTLLEKRTHHLNSENCSNSLTPEKVKQQTQQHLQLMQDHLWCLSQDDNVPATQIQLQAHTIDLTRLSQQAIVLTHYIDHYLGRPSVPGKSSDL